MKHFLLACLCATVCLSPARGQSSEQKQQTVLALQGLQAKDGGFLPVFAPGSKPAPKSSLRATTSALRALKYMGGEPRDKEACLVFVERCFDKESGGFAGTFSPNAAMVQAAFPLTAGHTYVFTAKWKTNRSATGTGTKIWAGAGPIGGLFSPTRLTAELTN